MNITILGAGSTGIAAASYFKLKNMAVKVYVRNAAKSKVWNQEPVSVSGVLNTSFYVPLLTDLKEAIDYGDILMVFTRSNDHEQVVEEIAPFLHEGQILLFVNGCWGAIKAARQLSRKPKIPDITIAETANMPFIAQLSPDFKSLRFKAAKEEIVYSCMGKDTALPALLKQMAERVVKVSSPAATSLSATNPIIHVSQCLFNITRIENGEDFHFFGAPLTKHVADFMEGCDKERLAIGKALGLDLSSLLDVLNGAWGDKKATLYEALTENESYKTVLGPKDISGRYLSEDLPCGMTSLLDLSEMMHVPAPHIEALVTTLYMYLGRKYEPFLTTADLRVLKALK